MLECPLYNPTKDSFKIHIYIYIFKNVVVGSIKSFFQLDHQVDISGYLTEATALRHSRILAGLKPS